jgi:hypothetical protein
MYFLSNGPPAGRPYLRHNSTQATVTPSILTNSELPHKKTIAVAAMVLFYITFSSKVD